jgi:hypothetical protein
LRLTARAAVALATVAWALPAAADDDKLECIAAAEKAQTERMRSKLRDAYAHLHVCSRDVCPRMVRDDCLTWLSQIEKSLPSLVLQVRDADGARLTDVGVSIDGAPALSHLDDTPLVVDPGPHTLRFERAGSPPVEQKITVAAGEKARIVAVQLGMPPAPPPAAPSPEPSPAPPEQAPTPREHPRLQPPEEPSHAERPIPAEVFVLGGIGVLALGSFVYFAVSGTSDVDHLRSTCGLNCSSSDVSFAHTQLLVADISLGVSVLALGAGAWLFFTRPEAPTQPSAGLTVQPLPGGGVARFTARF